MLNRRGAQMLADQFHNVVARCAIVAQHAYLDQFVGAEAAFHFSVHRGRHAATPHQYSRLQGMRAGLQASTFCGRQLWRHRALLKKAF